MKLLVDLPLLSYGKAGTYAGIQSFLHNPAAMNTYDTFDKINPDLYITDLDFVTETVLKNIEERPALKVVFVESGRTANRSKVESRFGNLYSFRKATEIADLVDYNHPVFTPEYKCDIVSIDQNLPEFIYSIDFPVCVKFRVFHSTLINYNRYCGFAVEPIRKNIYKSSKISLSTGNARYNSIVSDCYPIMPSNISELFDALDTDHTEELLRMKEEIYSKYNNFSILSEILNESGYDKESKVVLEKLKELR